MGYPVVHVQVPELAETLAEVVERGAEVDMPVTEAGRVTIAIFRDPASNRIGLARA